MDEGATAGVGTGIGSVPERTAEGDVAEVAGVDERVGVGVRARAIEGVRREGVAADLREVVEDGGVTRAGVCTEPGRVARARGGVGRSVAAKAVSRRRPGITTRVANLRRRSRGVALSGRCRSVKGGLPGRGATNEGCTLRQRTRGLRDRELAGDGGDVGVDISPDRNRLVLGINEVEEVGCLDRVLARTRKGEVVRSGD